MQKGSRIAALAFTLAVVAIGGTGLWYMTELVTRLDKSAVVEHVLRNHLEADMMHDALRGDVLAAQHQTLDRRTMTEGTGGNRPAFTRSFSDHVARFRQATAENKVLEAAEYRELAAVLASLNEPLAGYIAEAGGLGPLAFSDP